MSGMLDTATGVVGNLLTAAVKGLKKSRYKGLPRSACRTQLFDPHGTGLNGLQSPWRQQRVPRGIKRGCHREGAMSGSKATRVLKCTGK